MKKIDKMTPEKVLKIQQEFKKCQKAEVASLSCFAAQAEKKELEFKLQDNCELQSHIKKECKRYNIRLRCLENNASNSGKINQLKNLCRWCGDRMKNLGEYATSYRNRLQLLNERLKQDDC